MGRTLYEAILDDMKKDSEEVKAYDDYVMAVQAEHDFELQKRELLFKAEVIDRLMSGMDKLANCFIEQNSKANITIQVDSSMTPEKFEEIMKIVNKYR